VTGISGSPTVCWLFCTSYSRQGIETYRRSCHTRWRTAHKREASEQRRCIRRMQVSMLELAQGCRAYEGSYTV
jgi:hypothetical protein